MLISLVEDWPVLWDKTDDIYKDRKETRDFCICLQEDFEALGEYCRILLNTEKWNSYKLIFPYFMYSTVYIFHICHGTAPASVRK